MMWQKFPLVRLAVPFLLGMCVASALIGYVDWRLDMLFVIMASLLMMLVVCHNGWVRTPLCSHVFTAALFLLFVLFGAFLYIIRYMDVATAVDVSQTTLRGVVETPPWRTARSVALDMATPDGAHLRIYLQPSDDHNPQQLQRGDTLLIRPLHLNATCPLQQNDTSCYTTYNRYLFFQGISATCYALSRQWQHQPTARRDTTWNERLHQYYVQSPLDTTTLSMVEALTIGRREELSPQLRRQYSAAGVAHVLALSGMHLALLIGLLNNLIFRFFLYEQRRWLMLSVIPMLWVYTFVAGMPPSLVRAAVMASFLQFGFTIRREYSMLNALALAALVMLCWNPLQLQNVGFQLSFLSMLGVGVVFKPLYLYASPSAKDIIPHISFGLKSIRPFIRFTMMTLSCTLFTAPIVAYHFGQLPVYSLVTNIVVPFLVTLLLYTSVAWLLLFWWPAVQSLLGHGLEVLVNVQNTVVETIASWPAATIEVRPTFLVVLLYYFLLFFAIRRFLYRS